MIQDHHNNSHSNSAGISRDSSRITHSNNLRPRRSISLHAAFRTSSVSPATSWRDSSVGASSPTRTSSSTPSLWKLALRWWRTTNWRNSPL